MEQFETQIDKDNCKFEDNNNDNNNYCLQTYNNVKNSNRVFKSSPYFSYLNEDDMNPNSIYNLFDSDKDNRYRGGNSKTRTLMKVLVLLSVFALSFIITFFFGVSVSPLYQFRFDDMITDTSIFKLIGRLMVDKNYLPYVDIFDHKGLYLFLFYSFGYLLGDDIGYVVLTAILIAVSTIYFIKILNKINMSTRYKNMVFIIYVFSYIMILLTESLRCEDICFPLTFISIYLIIDLDTDMKLKSKTDRKKEVIYFLVIGFIIGVILNIKMTGLLPIFILAIIHIMVLFKLKKKINILYDLLLTLGGIFLSFVPIFIYSYSKGGFDYFKTVMYYSFIYQLKYGTDFNFEPYQILFNILNVVGLVIPFIFYTVKRKNLVSNFYFGVFSVSFIVNILFVSIIQIFPTYFVSQIPTYLVLLAITESCYIRNKKKVEVSSTETEVKVKMKPIKKLSLSFSIISFLTFIVTFSVQTSNYVSEVGNYQKYVNFLETNVVNNTETVNVDPLHDGKNFLVLDCPGTMYDVSIKNSENKEEKLVPSYKNAVLQSLHGATDKEIITNIDNYFKDKELSPEYVLIPSKSSVSTLSKMFFDNVENNVYSYKQVDSFKCSGLLRDTTYYLFHKVY